MADTTTTKQTTVSPPEKAATPPKELIPEDDLLVLNKDISLVKSKSIMMLWGDHQYGDPIIGFHIAIIKKSETEVLNFFHNGEAYRFRFLPNDLIGVFISDIKGSNLLEMTIKNKAPLVMEYKINDKVSYVNIPIKKLKVTTTYSIPRDPDPQQEEKFRKNKTTQTSNN